MNISDRKIEILSKFFIKSRFENDDDLDLLFSLDDYWNTIYQENRIKLSFIDAERLANKLTITKILSSDEEFRPSKRLSKRRKLQ